MEKYVVMRKTHLFLSMFMFMFMFVMSLNVQAQTTINVAITLDNDTQKIVNAWRNSQCKTKDADNKCIALEYDTLKDLIKSVVSNAINSQISTASQWALDNNDASLPGSVVKAVAAKQAADATITVIKQSKATVQ